jgi:toxin-antitoxin system PIN domain toxin
VILVDASLLVYASVTSTIHHKQAKQWLDERLNGEAPAGIPWTSLLGFLRLTTNPRIFDPPVPPREAWGNIEYWLECEPVWIPQPTEKHRAVLKRIYNLIAPQGNLVPDAHLAALAIEHGLTLCSTDGDFARFAELKWENPLHSTKQS